MTYRDPSFSKDLPCHCRSIGRLAVVVLRRKVGFEKDYREDYRYYLAGKSCMRVSVKWDLLSGYLKKTARVSKPADYFPVSRWHCYFGKEHTPKDYTSRLWHSVGYSDSVYLRAG